MSRAIASGCSATTGSRCGDRAAMHRGRPSGALAFCRRRSAAGRRTGKTPKLRTWQAPFRAYVCSPGVKERAWGKSRICCKRTAVCRQRELWRPTGKKKMEKQGVRYSPSALFALRYYECGSGSLTFRLLPPRPRRRR